MADRTTHINHNKQNILLHHENREKPETKLLLEQNAKQRNRGFHTNRSYLTVADGRGNHFHTRKKYHRGKEKEKTEL